MFDMLEFYNITKPIILLAPSPIADLSAPPANSLRLVDGSTTHEGRLEVYHNGEWGTVCDDFFDADDATVACRQLGFPGYDAFYYYSEFGEGLGRVWIANLFCNGNETELVDCDLYWEPSLDVCPHSEDVGVRCTDPDASEYPSMAYLEMKLTKLTGEETSPENWERQLHVL